MTSDRKATLVARAGIISDGLKKAKITHRLVEIGTTTDEDDVEILCFEIFSRKRMDKTLGAIYEKWQDVLIVSDRTGEASGRRELAVSFEGERDFSKTRADRD